MNKKLLYEIHGLYRDDFRIRGFYFGSGKKSACIVGSIRGNEIQQLFTCSMLVEELKRLENRGMINPGHEILIIPSVNPYSMNIKKRFWSTDNTDINRMFPGYELGETTQRIASAVFNIVKEYDYGMQFASFYMPGEFVPHVNLMKTGYEDVEMAKLFGLPYVRIRNTRPYDTTTLNFNWQIWETKAFSIYTTTTEKIDPNSAKEAVTGILNFLAANGIIQYHSHHGYHSQVVDDSEIVSVRTHEAGFFDCKVHAGDDIEKNQLLAEIRSPYEGNVTEEIIAPCSGVVFYRHDEPLVYTNTAVIKLIPNSIYK